MTAFDKLIQIKANNVRPSSGKILISEPFLNDFYFKRSVVLLLEHNKDGSLGLIVNKPIQVGLHEALTNFPSFDTLMYLGGPVKTEQIFYLHTLGPAVDGSQQITKDGIYWGGDLEIIKEMIALKAILPEQIRFFVGYSGWEAGQLENEIKTNSWLVSSASAQDIFSPAAEDIWTRMVAQMGDAYAIWNRYPSDPSLN